MDETRSGDANSNVSTDDLSFGAWLKHLRESRKITLEEVAAVTKIHITQLNHLESDQQEKLPAPAFIRGFLTAYARHLKVDEDEVLERFARTRKDKEKNNPLIVPVGSRAAQSTTFPKVRVVTSPTFGQAPGAKDLEQKKAPKITLKGALWISGAVVILLSLAIVVTLGKRHRQQQLQSSPVATESDSPPPPPVSPSPIAPPVPTASAPVTPAPQAPAPKTAAPLPVSTEAGTPTVAKKNTLEVRALEQSWINVRLDDGDSKGFPLKGGKSYTFSADRRVFLSLSNAGGVEIRWNGQWFAAPGYRGDVKSITLPDQLPNLTPRSAPAAVKAKAPAAPTPASTSENPAAAAAPSSNTDD